MANVDWETTTGRTGMTRAAADLDLAKRILQALSEVRPTVHWLQRDRPLTKAQRAALDSAIALLEEAAGRLSLRVEQTANAS